VLLGLTRSTPYHQPTPEPQSTLRIIARIDALYLEDPCSCSSMVAYLARDGIPISRDLVRISMRSMGLRAIFQKARTTVSRGPSYRLSCLFDLQLVTTVDQVLATDNTFITYIPLQMRFFCLVAIVELLSRNVLSLNSPTALTRSSVSMPW